MRTRLQVFVAVMAIGSATTAAMLIRANLSRQEAAIEMASAESLPAEPGRPTPLHELQPDPAFSPAMVVRHHVQALRLGVEQANGWRVAFRFTSPANREQVGGLESFVEVLGTPTFAALLHAEELHFGPVGLYEGERAAQDLRLESQGDEPVLYRVFLALQQEAPFDGCWMIDGIIRLERPPGQSNRPGDGVRL